MLEDEFEVCEVMGLSPDSEANKPHFVRLYYPSVYHEKPLERDVTELLKNKPYTTLVELIKYVAKDSKGDEMEIADHATGCIERWEKTGMRDIPFLTILALDEEKQPREFHDCVVKYSINEESGTCLWPTARAKDLFEKASKEGYRLDLYVGLMVI